MRLPWSALCTAYIVNIIESKAITRIMDLRKLKVSYLRYLKTDLIHTFQNIDCTYAVRIKKVYTINFIQQNIITYKYYT
jgi:hypothetical protein